MSFLSLFHFLSVACIARLYDEAEVDDALVPLIGKEMNIRLKLDRVWSVRDKEQV